MNENKASVRRGNVASNKLRKVPANYWKGVIREKRAEIKKLYVDHGCTIEQIARKLKINESALRVAFSNNHHWKMERKAVTESHNADLWRRVHAIMR